ncbi:hypothetical protein GCM10010495_68950 [Kitasatospora herbaricolor]|nr:hypothetical protein GCM10010495_68950 [Kitasatospora herbaricolor]
MAVEVDVECFGLVGRLHKRSFSPGVGANVPARPLVPGSGPAGPVGAVASHWG